MPKIQRIFEQDGETCVSLGKIEGEGNLVFMTEEERQKMLRDEKNYWLDEAAKLADEYSTYYTIEARILALKEKL